MNTIQRTLASLLAGGATMAAGAAMAQVTVNAPGGNPAAAPTNVQAGPVNVQNGPNGTTVTVPQGAAEAAAGIVNRRGENAAERQTLRQERVGERQAAREDWRMRNHNGRWWYWGPNNQWSVYQNNAWSPYAPNATLTPPAVPTPNANVAPAAPATNVQPTQAYRRGPLGIRRYSMGYRGAPVAQLPASTQGNAPPANSTSQPGLSPTPQSGTANPGAATTPSGSAPSPAPEAQQPRP